MLQSINKQKEKIVFLIVLIAFVLYKIQHLDIPLFWDEMGVYGKSIFFLLDHKIGLLPNYLDPELSRGHPMMYVFLTASFSNIFGSDVFSMHLFNLIVSVGGLLSLFYISQRLFDIRTALFAVIILMVQPLFIAQSILLSPEIMLSVFILWSMYFFLEEKWVLYFFASSFAMLTKETAVFMPLVLGFVLFIWNLFVYKKVEIKKSIIILLPYSTFVLFLIIQKSQHGWYFFPYHNPFEGDKGFFDFQILFMKFKKFWTIILFEQGRIYTFFTAVILFIVYLFKNHKKYHFQLIVIIAMIVGLVLFSSTNYVMKRYMLLALFLSAIIYAFLVTQVFKSYFLLQLLVVFVLISFSIKNITSKTFEYDRNMSYLEFVAFQKNVTQFLESQKDWKDGVVVKSNFPMNITFEDQRYGYSSKDINIIVKARIEDDTKYILQTRPGSKGGYKIPTDFSELKHPTKGFNSIKIYRRNE